MRLGLTDWLTKGDWLALIAALLLVPSLYAAYWHSSGQGQEARVWVDGKPWARLDLFREQHLEVPGVLGISHLVIGDGRVRFVDSPCPNRQCVHTGWLSEGGDVAACLPNRVSVQIMADDPRFDSINF